MVQGTTTYGYSCLGLDSLIEQTTFDDTISDTMLSGVSFYLFVISVSLFLSLSLLRFALNLFIDSSVSYVYLYISYVSRCICISIPTEARL